jgi:hypothetical protein
MKTIILLLLTITISLSCSSQFTLILTPQEIETETKTIREYYKFVNIEKKNCKETETYWSLDDELREKYGDNENEYNEEGNEEINEIEYTCNGEKNLLVRDTRISKYQEPYNKTIHEEYYFKNDELIFYYLQSIEILNGPDYMDYTDMEEGERAKEIRIYLKNGKIFKYLTKEVYNANDAESDALLLLPDVKNNTRDLNSLINDDYEAIYEYLK